MAMPDVMRIRQQVNTSYQQNIYHSFVDHAKSMHLRRMGCTSPTITIYRQPSRRCELQCEQT